jgi:hypothetical protein
MQHAVENTVTPLSFEPANNSDMCISFADLHAKRLALACANLRILSYMVLEPKRGQSAFLKRTVCEYAHLLASSLPCESPIEDNELPKDIALGCRQGEARMAGGLGECVTKEYKSKSAEREENKRAQKLSKTMIAETGWAFGIARIVHLFPHLQLQREATQDLFQAYR